MKHIISILSALCVVLSCVFLLAGCGKKHVIDTELGTGDLALSPTLATRSDAGYLEITTDGDGETVTNAEGETVTAAVTQAEKTTKSAGETTTAKKQETTTKASSGKQETTTASALTTEPELTVPAGKYLLSLTADKTEVKAGDALTLTLHLKNCPYVACFGFTVEYGGKVSVTKYKSNKFVNEDGERFDIFSNDTDEGVLFSGLITNTYDFLDDDLFTVTYTVASNVKAGDKLTFRAVPTSFLIATDASGAVTEDYSGVLKEATLTVTVK